MFEFTPDRVKRIVTTSDGKIDFDALRMLPCLFMQEGHADEVVRVGKITSVNLSNREVTFDYIVDADALPLTNRDIYRHQADFGLDDFEFSRNHWAIKSVDLYQAILKVSRGSGRSKPKVFQVSDREDVDPALLSVMMPFDGSLRPVFDDIKAMAGTIGMKCQRGDDIWVNDAIIQDVVDLIDKSRIVICDLTGRNANVFYETGIAHTLGRDIILITQNADDVPFDLRHLRYIKYLNNSEGRAELCEAVKKRIGTLVV
jgi:hypothetical protein